MQSLSSSSSSDNTLQSLSSLSNSNPNPNLHRHLSFVGRETDFYAHFFFGFLAFFSFLLFFRAFKLGSSHIHFSENKVIRLFFPLCIAIAVFDNIVMAFGDEVGTRGITANILFLLHPFMIPILLLTSFEITYLVHKKRSVNFCGMKFDQGGRRIKLSFKSWILRNMIGMVAVALVAFALISNFEVISEYSYSDDDLEAGTVGMFHLINEDDWSWDTSWHRVFGLLPTFILVIANTYFAIVMLMYGTQSSMIIYSSCLNPWISQLVGTIFLAVGQAFSSPKAYAIVSNAGEVSIIFCTLFLMYEVDKDMIAASEFTDFLNLTAARQGARILTEHEQEQLDIKAEQAIDERERQRKIKGGKFFYGSSKFKGLSFGFGSNTGGERDKSGTGGFSSRILTFNGEDGVKAKVSVKGRRSSVDVQQLEVNAYQPLVWRLNNGNLISIGCGNDVEDIGLILACYVAIWSTATAMFALLLKAAIDTDDQNTVLYAFLFLAVLFFLFVSASVYTGQMELERVRRAREYRRVREEALRSEGSGAGASASAIRAKKREVVDDVEEVRESENEGEGVNNSRRRRSSSSKREVEVDDKEKTEMEKTVAEKTKTAPAKVNKMVEWGSVKKEIWKIENREGKL